MERKFPLIEKNNIVILGVDSNTGILLNEFLSWAGPSDRVYITFSAIEDAIAHIKKAFDIKKDIEFTVFDFQGEILTQLFSK